MLAFALSIPAIILTGVLLYKQFNPQGVLIVAGLGMIGLSLLLHIHSCRSTSFKPNWDASYLFIN
jgi:hypothetical protein